MVKKYLHIVNYNYKITAWQIWVFDFTISSDTSMWDRFTSTNIDIDVLFDAVVINNVIIEFIFLNDLIIILTKLWILTNNDKH